jgi:hypothetical protein
VGREGDAGDEAVGVETSPRQYGPAGQVAHQGWMECVYWDVRRRCEGRAGAEGDPPCVVW